MNGESDILFLITSHGSRDGLAVVAGRLAETLTPSRLSEMLGRTGVRNKVVIISACYSGVFIPISPMLIRLSSPRQMLTIRRSNARTKPSGPTSATLNAALRRANNLKDAFLMARSTSIEARIARGILERAVAPADGWRWKVEPLLMAHPSRIPEVVEK